MTGNRGRGSDRGRVLETECESWEEDYFPPCASDSVRYH